MVYTPPEYPAAIPEYAEIWPWNDDIDDVVVDAWDAAIKEIRAIMTELGVDPAGTKADVVTRLDDMDTALALPHFYNRGDPAAFDKAIGDFTSDGTWREMDLAATGLPEEANAVLCKLYLQDDAVASAMNFRRDDNANTVNTSYVTTQVANIAISVDIIIPCKLAKIEYNGTNLAFSAISLVVKGWWL